MLLDCFAPVATFSIIFEESFRNNPVHVVDYTAHWIFFVCWKVRASVFLFLEQKYVACTYFGDNTYKCVCFSFSQAKNGGLAVNAQGRWYDEDGE